MQPNSAVIEKRPTIAIVHTSLLAVDALTAQFEEIAPEVVLRHIVDSSLLPEVMEAGAVTLQVRDRLLRCFMLAADTGCDLVLSQCSSVGEVADEASRLLSIPVVKIDAAMAREACATGRRIGIVATLETTLGPTRRLIESSAREAGREVELTSRLIEGAFPRFSGGDIEGHDTLVADAVRDLASRVDVIVCAQGSMARVVGRLGETAAPVLTSLRLVVEDAIATLRASVGR